MGFLSVPRAALFLKKMQAGVIFAIIQKRAINQWKAGSGMKKQEILKHLSDQVLEVINYLEEHCDYEQLFEDGLYAMLYIRYQNALSLLREKSPGYSRLQAGLQFLISANRAYVGASSDWEDPLRKLLSEADRLVDQYLHDDKKEEKS